MQMPLTWPNRITFARFAAIPVFVILVLRIQDYGRLWQQMALGVFVVLVVADVVEMVEDYNRRRKFIVKGLNEIGLACFEPMGAFYAFPSIAVTGMTSEEFSERLLKEEKVAVVPGSAFGECGEGYVRCCYATSLADIEEALTRMGRFVKKYKK